MRRFDLLLLMYRFTVHKECVANEPLVSRFVS